MDISAVVQIVLLIVIAVTGSICNVGTIFIFTFDKLTVSKSALDTTARCLTVQICCCYLIMCGIAIPLRVWNIIVGGGDNNNVFYDQSAACWIYVAARYVWYGISWLMLSVAITRLVATFAPHKYETSIQNNCVVRWMLYLIPLTLTCGIFLLQIMYFFKASVDSTPSGGGLCKIQAYKSQGFGGHKIPAFLVLLWISLPLILVTLAYVMIYIKIRRFKRKIPKSANDDSAAPPTGSETIKLSTGSSSNAASSSTLLMTTPTHLTAKPSSSNSNVRTARLLMSLKVLAWSSLLFVCCFVLRSLVFGYLLITRSVWLVLMLECLQYGSSCLYPLICVIVMKDVRAAWLRIFTSAFSRRR